MLVFQGSAGAFFSIDWVMVNKGNLPKMALIQLCGIFMYVIIYPGSVITYHPFFNGWILISPKRLSYWSIYSSCINSINAFDMSLDPGRYDLIVLFDIFSDLYTYIYLKKCWSFWGSMLVNPCRTWKWNDSWTINHRCIATLEKMDMLRRGRFLHQSLSSRKSSSFGSNPMLIHI